VAKNIDEKDADSVTQEVEKYNLVDGSAKDVDENDGDPAMQEVQDNDFVVGVDPGNTNIITIAVPKCAEDGTDGNLRQKDMRLFEVLESKILSRIRYNECEVENLYVEFRNERSPGSYERGDEPRSGLYSFSEIHRRSVCALGCAVGRIYKAPAGSSAHESILWETAGVRELFQ
jgi:hypothetical protein